MKAKSSGVGNHTVMILIAVSLLLVAISIFWQSISTSSHKEKFESRKLTVMLFHATWCSHCVRYLASGKWDKSEQAVKASYKAVEFEKHDFDKLSKEKAAKYNIQSFPTILAEDSNGRIYRFNGIRDMPEHVVKFVSAALDGKELAGSDF
jgi:thiol-disulfide isomerase/thioredoxin